MCKLDIYFKYDIINIRVVNVKKSKRYRKEKTMLSEKEKRTGLPKYSKEEIEQQLALNKAGVKGCLSLFLSFCTNEDLEAELKRREEAA